ncbi:hypothetical protein E4U53_004903, partial [Claviceps sorghi]
PAGDLPGVGMGLVATPNRARRATARPARAWGPLCRVVPRCAPLFPAVPRPIRGQGRPHVVLKLVASPCRRLHCASGPAPDVGQTTAQPTSNCSPSPSSSPTAQDMASADGQQCAPEARVWPAGPDAIGPHVYWRRRINLHDWSAGANKYKERQSTTCMTRTSTAKRPPPDRAQHNHHVHTDVVDVAE